MSRLAPVFLVAAAGAIALAGCAPTTSTERTASTTAPGRQCLFQNDIQSFRVNASSQTIYVRGVGKAVFEMQTAGYCRDLDNTMALGFLPQGGLTRLCTGDWTQVVPSGATPPVTPCRVRIVRKLSEAEVAALPERDRP